MEFCLWFTSVFSEPWDWGFATGFSSAVLLVSFIVILKVGTRSYFGFALVALFCVSFFWAIKAPQEVGVVNALTGISAAFAIYAGARYGAEKQAEIQLSVLTTQIQSQNELLEKQTEKQKELEAAKIKEQRLFDERLAKFRVLPELKLVILTLKAIAGIASTIEKHDSSVPEKEINDQWISRKELVLSYETQSILYSLDDLTLEEKKHILKITMWLDAKWFALATMGKLEGDKFVIHEFCRLLKDKRDKIQFDLGKESDFLLMIINKLEVM